MLPLSRGSVLLPYFQQMEAHPTYPAKRSLLPFLQGPVPHQIRLSCANSFLTFLKFCSMQTSKFTAWIHCLQKDLIAPSLKGYKVKIAIYIDDINFLTLIFRITMMSSKPMPLSLSSFKFFDVLYS